MQQTHLDDSGHAAARITVTNGGMHTDSYAVQAGFHDRDGDLVAVVVVTVSSVEPGGTAHADARSDRELPAKTTAEVAEAVRY
ncbi:hypothetical protein ACFSL4_26005 [Streptomyces caeni]|uniref:Uncharacterized protein n=1 Tax=Streptomyces caeni TaxID=2307231 RepID=A0ABW4IXB1_9ACTN